MEHIKLKNGRVPLGLELTKHVIKSQIHIIFLFETKHEMKIKVFRLCLTVSFSTILS
jgi:hypothetical protein